MKNDLFELFRKNIFSVNLEDNGKIYKKGTFTNYDDVYKEDIEYAYLLNLCTEDKTSTIRKDVNGNNIWKCLYTLSCGENSIPNLFEYEFVGTKEQTLELKIKDRSLTDEEQKMVLLYMISTYNNEKCSYLKQLKTNAYLKYIKTLPVFRNKLVQRLYTYYDSLVNDKYKELEQMVNDTFDFEVKDIYEIPLIFKRDIEILLAHLYLKFSMYEKSLTIFRKYSMTRYEIEVLIRLGKTDEAVYKIKEVLSSNYSIEVTETITHKKKDYSLKERIGIQEYFVKLGWILKDTKYFDEAYCVYRSFEPLEHKGIFLYKQEDFVGAKETYKKALEIVPENERLLFAFVSVKINLKEYYDCIDLLKRLLEKDRKNVEYTRNLSLCYLFLNENERCMDTLRENAIRDKVSLELYLSLSIQNDKPEQVLWCLKRIENSKANNDVIDWLFKSEYLPKEEIINVLRKNPYFEGMY